MGWLEDPLVLLWRQRDDSDVAIVGPQVVDLPLDSLAGFVDFLKDGCVTINPGVTYLSNTWLNNGSECGRGNGGSPLQNICSIAPSDGGN